MTNYFYKGLSEGFKPDPNINLVEWANSRFFLSKESSAEYGQYRSSRTPFVEEPLLELSPQSKTEIVVVVKPTQCGGTTIAFIFLCSIIDLYPGPMMFMMPTDSMAKSFSKKKLANTIKNVPSLKEKVKSPKSRDSGNTILQKDFPGGSVMLTGSNSGASFRSESIKYLVLDDFDAFEMDIEGEGSPEELADRRTGTFAGRKIYINSTTTLKGTSNIEIAFEKSSQGFFEVPCPHCNEYQYLEWGGKDANFGIKFTRDEGGVVDSAWYECKHCYEKISENEKPKIIEAGKYIHRYPDRKVRGFKWNALYTPLGWVNSWTYIAQKFVEATAELKNNRNPALYKTWLNSFMSESYEESGDTPEWTVLKGRAEPYELMTVPDGGQMLTMGVDVQDDRLAFVVDAWGIAEESWTIYHGEIYGDPSENHVWNQLQGIIDRPYKCISGDDKHIISVAVDSGGHRTQEVYNYCRFRQPKVIAIKGASTKNRPVIGRPNPQDVTYLGKKIEKGIQLWPVGTDTAKSSIYSRLKLDTPGPGYIHFPIGLSDEFYIQLCSEKLTTKFVKGYPVQEWVKINTRNEVLDCKVYSYAAAIRAGLLTLHPEVQNIEQPKPKNKPSSKTEYTKKRSSGFLRGVKRGYL